MDPAIACDALGAAPAAVDEHAAIWAGSLVPVVVPLACLPPGQRVPLLLGREEIPIAARVGAALDAGLEDAAWNELARVSLPLSAPRGLDTTLSLWAARESARLQLPAPRGAVIIPADAKPALADAAATALGATQNLLPLAWPRWIGAVVLVPTTGDFGSMPASASMLARQALPLLRADADADRAQLARGLCRLALALSGPPRGGWPPWLERGLCAMAAERANDAVISPAKMHEIRHAAGQAGIAAILAGRDPDERVAEALCVPLLHPSERKHFSALLDLLRNGAGSEGALRVAYGLTLQKLVDD